MPLAKYAMQKNVTDFRSVLPITAKINRCLKDCIA